MGEAENRHGLRPEPGSLEVGQQAPDHGEAGREPRLVLLHSLQEGVGIPAVPAGFRSQVGRVRKAERPGKLEHALRRAASAVDEYHRQRGLVDRRAGTGDPAVAVRSSGARTRLSRLVFLPHQAILSTSEAWTAR